MEDVTMLTAAMELAAILAAVIEEVAMLMAEMEEATIRSPVIIPGRYPPGTVYRVLISVRESARL